MGGRTDAGAAGPPRRPLTAAPPGGDVIRPGAILECPPGSWKFTTSPATLFLLVERVREDLSHYYEGQVWIEGEQLARDGTPLGHMEALITLARVKVVREPGSETPERVNPDDG
jgi:hypothetical protein